MHNDLETSRRDPLTALRLVEFCEEAEFSHGVLTILTDLSETTGAALVQSNNIDKVTFTGSLEVGKKNCPGGGRKFEAPHTRIGRQSPSVIFADADLDSAIPAAALSTPVARLFLASMPPDLRR